MTLTETNATATDAGIRQAVIAELSWTSNLDSTFITVTVSAGAVSLAGEVDSYPEKRHAEKAALRVRGVTAVDERITVRSLWGVGSDAVLAVLANEALERTVDLPANSVTASAHHRVVTLSGAVPWQHQRVSAERAVGQVMGVIGVTNGVVLAPDATPDRVHTAIKAALMRSAELEGDRVEVTSVAGDVTLEGRVRTWAERHAAEFAAWSAPGVTNVNNHLVIDRCYVPEAGDRAAG